MTLVTRGKDLKKKRYPEGNAYSGGWSFGYQRIAPYLLRVRARVLCYFLKTRAKEGKAIIVL